MLDQLIAKFRECWHDGKLGSIRSKYSVGWLHLSQMKVRLYEQVDIFAFQMKTQQVISGTSAATYKVMEPH